MRTVTNERSVGGEDIRAFPQRDGEKPTLAVQSHIDVFQGDILTEYPAGDSHLAILSPLQAIEVAMCRRLWTKGDFVHRVRKSGRALGLTRRRSATLTTKSMIWNEGVLLIRK
jgi:hypothetical protein